MTTFNDWWKTYIADPGRADLRFNVQAETAALDAWEAAQAAQLPTGWPRASRGQAPAQQPDASYAELADKLQCGSVAFGSDGEWVSIRRYIRDEAVAALRAAHGQAPAPTTAAQPPALTGDLAEPRDDSDRIYDRPVGYLPAYELSRLHSGHGAQLRSAKFGPSALDGDVPVYLESSALALVQALIGAQRAINSMKVEAETAAQGDEQMMLDACEQISNEGLEASLAIQAALSAAAQPPAGIWVPTELAERVQETLGEFLMDHGWRQQDMDTSDEFSAALAAAPKASA